MTKRRKLNRSNKPVPEGASGYAARRRLPWSERHKGHTIRVHACPYCMPESTQQETLPRPTLPLSVCKSGI